MNRIVIVGDHPAFRAWARAVLAALPFTGEMGVRAHGCLLSLAARLGSAGGAEAEISARGRQPGLPPRFARVLGRQVAAGELVTAQRRNPAQRTGSG